MTEGKERKTHATTLQEAMSEYLRDLFGESTPFRGLTNLLEGHRVNPFIAEDKMPLAMSMKETEDGYIIKMEVPGVPSSDLRVEHVDDMLRISGTFGTDLSEEPDGKVLYSGRAHGAFQRALYLPSPLFDLGKSEAKVKDGVLTITVPKIKPKEPVRVEVKGE